MQTIDILGGSWAISIPGWPDVCASEKLVGEAYVIYFKLFNNALSFVFNLSI